jgi:sulfite exporter TauE/SafE
LLGKDNLIYNFNMTSSGPIDSFSGFMLGISTGAACLGSCGPVFASYLLGRGGRLSHQFYLLGLFLAGRAISYLAWAIAAGLAGRFILDRMPAKGIVFGVLYVSLGAALALYGFRRNRCGCAGSCTDSEAPKTNMFWRTFPLTMGLMTGLNICAPLTLAFTRAAQTGSVTASFLFFAAFYAGTSIYFIPLPAVGLLGRNEVIKQVGRLAAGTIGLYYVYAGAIMMVVKK